MSSTSGQTLLEYRYTRTATVATTGYFACVPEVNLSFVEFLRLLGGRPLDTFLHRHVLHLLQDMEDIEVKKLLTECLSAVQAGQMAGDCAEKAVLAKLFLEAAAFLSLPEEILPKLRSLADNLTENSPLPDCSEAEKTEYLRQALTDNIQSHWDLPQHILEKAAKMSFAKNSDAGRIKAFAASSQAAVENVLPPAQVAAKAMSALDAAGLLAGQEMRHEASLSPIALLREWRIDVLVHNRRMHHHLEGTATAYGRGLSLAAARASCLMEIVERACAYASIEEGGEFGHGLVTGRSGDLSLYYNSYEAMRKAGIPAVDPVALGAVKRARQAAIHWLKGIDATGKNIFVPAAAVLLFCNLDEPEFFTCLGSTGLASGTSREQARLAGLLEVLERHAHSTVPFVRNGCFRLASRDQRIQSLLDDYAVCNIYPQFQDIGTAFGVPVYRCFVEGTDGTVAQASGAGLNGARAVLSALTETPWPYSWATQSPFARPSRRPDQTLPTVFLEDLPNYDLGSHAANLALVEKVLASYELMPVYADIGRADLPFFVNRVFVPGLETDIDWVARTHSIIQL